MTKRIPSPFKKGQTPAPAGRGSGTGGKRASVSPRGKGDKRLRKQPQMRRIQAASAASLAGASMSKTAQKRKRRQSAQRIARPLSTARAIVFNARWLSLGIMGLCVYALYLIGVDQRFYLNYIPVQGATSLEINDVVAESGLAGRHIFAADPQAAADRIGQMGGVVTATVTLHWPNEVLVSLREKPPLATWEEGSETYWIDEDGNLSLARAETVGLLHIVSEEPVVDAGEQGSGGAGETDANAESASSDAESASSDAESTAPDANDEEPATDDQQATTNDETADDGTTANIAFVPRPVLEGAIQLRQLRPNIDKLYYNTSGGLSYQDGRGWRAYFGSGRDMHQKLAVYETVVASLMGRGLRPEYISVSNQYKPFYRLLP